jgi:hypothetical protein
MIVVARMSEVKSGIGPSPGTPPRKSMRSMRATLRIAFRATGIAVVFGDVTAI